MHLPEWNDFSLPLTKLLPVWQASAHNCDPLQRWPLWTMLEKLLAEIEQVDHASRSWYLLLAYSLYPDYQDFLNVSEIFPLSSVFFTNTALVQASTVSQGDCHWGLPAGLLTSACFSFLVDWFLSYIFLMCLFLFTFLMFLTYFHTFYGMGIIFIKICIKVCVYIYI